MRNSIAIAVALAVVVAAAVSLSAASAPGPVVGINVILKAPADDATLGQLAVYGKVRDVIPEINGVTMQAAESQLSAIRALPAVASAGLDQPRSATPVRTQSGADMSAGQNTWDLDAINVTDFGQGRVVDSAGLGVNVAVLDTGLVNNWTTYFPADRIDAGHARAFGGGGGDVGTVSSQPNKWQEDQDSHGTHVTSTILGYNFGARVINGVAPKATVIPVKVLNQSGWGWSSVIARGITYVADLKANELAGSPMVVNMSLGGRRDEMEIAAIDYAISKGVIIVAAAGNEGEQGMGYPGAYGPVISVAASGWVNEWTAPSWWRTLDVSDPLNPADYYIADFSSRQLKDQDLDVAAPGSWVLGPYQTNGQISYYYLGGTSMASPHVAGIVALMAEKDPSLTAAEAEIILESTAAALPAGCRTVDDGWGKQVEVCWKDDATGAGLVTADAALKAMGANNAAGGKKK